jgi:Zn-dependent protease
LSTASFQPSDHCRNCNQPLPRGAVSCPQCHTLIHSDQLAYLSAQAKKYEQMGELQQARETWLKCLSLLPAESKQAEWIRGQVESLDIEIATGESDRNKWAKRLGPLAPIIFILAKGKTLLGLLKLKFLFSFVSFIGVYWALYGAWFGVGFATSILIHELGHYIDIKRRGLPVEAPVFIPGFGAYVKWDALGVTDKVKAEVSLAGPLAGFAAAVFCAAMWMKTGEGIWAALARTGAWLNVLNLIPIWQLDGSGAIKVLDKLNRVVLLVVALFLWYALHQGGGGGVFFLVALGIGYRLFTKDEVKEASFSIALYYAALLGLLALIMHLVPHQGRGI